MTQYCTFRLADQLFGVPVASVQEVLRPLDVTPVPLSAPEVSGLVNLRGEIVTTLELRARFGIEPRAAGAPSVCLVARNADGSAVSLVVDAIGDVLELDERVHEPLPDTVAPWVRELVSSVAKLEEELLLVLDTERATHVEVPA